MPENNNLRELQKLFVAPHNPPAKFSNYAGTHYQFAHASTGTRMVAYVHLSRVIYQSQKPFVALLSHLHMDCSISAFHGALSDHLEGDLLHALCLLSVSQLVSRRPRQPLQASPYCPSLLARGFRGTELPPALLQSL